MRNLVLHMEELHVVCSSAADRPQLLSCMQLLAADFETALEDRFLQQGDSVRLSSGLT